MGPDAVSRSFGDEWPSIQQGIRGNINEFNRFFKNDPILSRARDASTTLLDFGMNTILPGAMKMFDVGMNKVLPAGINVLDTGQKIMGYGQDIMGAATPDILQTIKTHGALPGWQERDVGEATQAAAAATGMGHSLGTIGQRLMNRGAAQEARLNTAINRAGLVGQIASGTMASGLSALSGPGQALPFLMAPGQATGSFIQPGLATEQTAASAYKGLSDPSWQYMSNLFDFNANAAQSANNAEASKNSALTAAGIKSVGSIVGGIAMSDEELKEDIKDTGFKIRGVPVKTFRFKESKDRQVGTIAQEVAKIRPDAVRRLSNGTMLVDYSRLLNTKAA